MSARLDETTAHTATKIWRDIPARGVIQQGGVKRPIYRAQRLKYS